MGHVLVFGHRNPDNDSICSAVAYAHLKNVTDPERVYIAGRLGEPPAETRAVFERFGVALPEEIEHVRTRVRDVMITDVVKALVDDVVLTVGRFMREQRVRSVPVVDAHGAVRGIVTMDTLARSYLDEFEVPGFSRVPTTVGRLVEALGGRLHAGRPEAELAGEVVVAAMEPDSLLDSVSAGDTVVMGDRRRSQPAALRAGAACLVVTGGATPTPEALAAANDTGAAVISTPHGAYASARLIGMSHAVSEIMETDVLLVPSDALLSEVAEDLFASPHRAAVVVDASGRLEGLLTRTNVAQAPRREVVLVDHNEASQSAEGIDQAAVIEVVDHHRIGDIQTSGPIAFRNLPVGATATIVAQRYRELDVTLPTNIAGLLLSAILTDTLLLKSPTASQLDHEIADWLAQAVGVQVVEFGMDVLRARTQGREFDVSETVEADLKDYRIGDALVGVAQHETVDAQAVMMHARELAAYLEELRERRGYDLVLLLVTDVIREGSEALASGRVRLAEKAFGVRFEDDRAWLPGVLSRKQQVVPRLMRASGA